jgi:hypothetical protein
MAPHVNDLHLYNSLCHKLLKIKTIHLVKKININNPAAHAIVYSILNIFDLNNLLRLFSSSSCPSISRTIEKPLSNRHPNDCLFFQIIKNPDNEFSSSISHNMRKNIRSIIEGCEIIFTSYLYQ